MKYLLAAALIFALGVVDGLYGRIDDLIVSEARLKAENAEAALHIADYVECLNGKSLQDEALVVDCRRRRK